MNTALKNAFDAPAMLNILSFVPVDDFEIETLFGFTHIYGTKHYITYGGGPEGGFVYFTSEGQKGRGGWYRWHRDWYNKNCLHQGC